MSALFALLSRSPLVTNADLLQLVKPAELCAADCARAWGIEPPAVVLEDTLSPGAIAVMFVSDGTSPGAIAEHFPGGLCRVHVDRTADLLTGDDGALNGLTHELNEAGVDPGCDLWKPHPTRPGVEVALEVCDPCQDSYRMARGIESGAVELADVANYVLPSWFERDAAYPYDHAGRLSTPGQIGPSGYIILRDASGRTWLEDSGGAFPELSAAQHARLTNRLGRTARRMQLHAGGKLRGPRPA